MKEDKNKKDEANFKDELCSSSLLALPLLSHAWNLASHTRKSSFLKIEAYPVHPPPRR